MIDQDTKQIHKKRTRKLTNYKMLPVLAAVFAIAVLIVIFGMSRTQPTVAPGITPNTPRAIAPSNPQKTGPATSDGNQGTGQTAGTPGARDE